MAEGMGSEVPDQEKDHSIEIEVENDQLKLLLEQAAIELKRIEDSDQIQRLKTKARSVNNVKEINDGYAEVRRKVDEIRQREESGVRMMPIGEIKQAESEELQSKYEYDVLNALMMRVVDEVKLLAREGVGEELSLAKQKGKALKTARDNTEYGYARLQKESAA